MTGPDEEPTSEGPTQEQPGSGWASPPAWGSAPQGWTRSSAPIAPPNGPVTPPSMAPSPDPTGWSGGSWTYGYGGAWSPPPPPPQPPNAARRLLAAFAVVLLVLASGGVGAVISSAVRDDSTSSPIASPFDGSTNNDTGSGTATDRGQSSAIAAKVNPALVNIYTTIDTGAGRGQAAGTGMVITSSGEVLTNNHVIADSTTVRVELVATGSTHTANVLGYDVKDDIALLKIDDVSDLATVSFADASKVAIGDAVVAIGNAGGRGGAPTVSSGSVSALDQKVTAGDQGNGRSETLAGMIEISAPIEPGDSGGPLVNSNGQVIGMNTAAATSDRFTGQIGSSTAFAIPINRALQVARQIKAGEESANVHVGGRGLLGIRVRDIASQTSCPSVPIDSGALVADVSSGSPAQSAGLGTCDVIVAIGGKNIASTSDLNEAMFPYHPGEKVTVGWVDQSGGRQRASVELVSGPPV